MKGLLICSKRLLLLVDSWCYNNLSTYQLLYSHWHLGCYGNLTGLQIHPISSIQLHFTQKVVGELPFLLHQNCLHIKEHFLRKLLSRGFRATLIFCNIKPTNLTVSPEVALHPNNNSNTNRQKSDRVPSNAGHLLNPPLELVHTTW